MMLLGRNRARATLRKAESTNFINYIEISIRMLVALALLLSADDSKIPNTFKLVG